MNNKATFIPIASGKGGVGKSMFAANLAIALAAGGDESVAVDLDFGGSNLYTFLGISNKYPGIGDYFKSSEIRFNDLFVQTSIPNLRFIPGDGRIPFMANISREQRGILLKHIRNISAKYVLLDIGAGTAFNSLQFFGLSYRGIIVTTFEIPSIMNFIMFLRNFIFRVIAVIVHGNKKVFSMVNKAFNVSIHATPVTVKTLISKIKEMDQDLAEKVETACSRYRPRIVFNMSDSPENLKVLAKIRDTLKKGLSIDVEFLGCIFFDKQVRAASIKGDVFLYNYPESIAAKSIKQIAKNISRNLGRPIENSHISLMKEATRTFEVWSCAYG